MLNLHSLRYNFPAPTVPGRKADVNGCSKFYALQNSHECHDYIAVVRRVNDLNSVLLRMTVA